MCRGQVSDTWHLSKGRERHPSSLMPVLSSRILMAATLVGAACGFSPAAMGAPRSAARRVAMPQPVMEMEVRLAAS